MAADLSSVAPLATRRSGGGDRGDADSRALARQRSLDLRDLERARDQFCSEVFEPRAAEPGIELPPRAVEIGAALGFAPRALVGLGSGLAEASERSEPSEPAERSEPAGSETPKETESE